MRYYYARRANQVIKFAHKSARDLYASSNTPSVEALTAQEAKSIGKPSLFVDAKGMVWELVFEHGVEFKLPHWSMMFLQDGRIVNY